MRFFNKGKFRHLSVWEWAAIIAGLSGIAGVLWARTHRHRHKFIAGGAIIGLALMGSISMSGSRDTDVLQIAAASCGSTADGQCLYETSGNQSDRPWKCSDGLLVEDNKVCGCPGDSYPWLDGSCTHLPQLKNFNQFIPYCVGDPGSSLATCPSYNDLPWIASHIDITGAHAHQRALIKQYDPLTRISSYVNLQTFTTGEVKSGFPNYCATNTCTNPEEAYLHFIEDTQMGTRTEGYICRPGYNPSNRPAGWTASNPGCSTLSTDHYSRATSTAASRVNDGYLPGWRWVNFSSDWVNYTRYKTINLMNYGGVVSDYLFSDISDFKPMNSNLEYSQEYYGIPTDAANANSHPRVQEVFDQQDALRTYVGNYFGRTKELIVNSIEPANYLVYPWLHTRYQTLNPINYFQLWDVYENSIGAPVSGSGRAHTYTDYLRSRTILQESLQGYRFVLSGYNYAASEIPRSKKYLLSYFYLLNNKNLIFEYYDATSEDPPYGQNPDTNDVSIREWGWSPLMDYNIGRPVTIPSGKTDVFGAGAATGTTEHYLFASGIDPSTTNNARTYTNDSNCKTAQGAAIQKNYYIFARNYSKALVLTKFREYCGFTDASSATTHALGGTYYQLNDDGTVASTPITSITLKNNEGAILIPASVVAGCTENWYCSDWFACSAGQQTRQCWDLNTCGTTTNRPTLTMSCGPVDTTPPAPVTLTSTDTTADSVTLQWIAPGDDGSSGTASQYDIRYSTSELTIAIFNSATQVTGEPTPLIAGTTQSMTVSGLNSGTTYYFVIKSSDDVGNISGFNNILQVTTDDITPPAAITNLASGTVSTNSVILTWTAPGDDGSTGTATSYDVRYSSSPITSSNFTSATSVTGEPTPTASGTTQTMTVTGLSAGTTYYFAMTASDEAANSSSLSNSITVTTTSAPPSADTTAPAAITNLAASNSTVSSVILTWTAPGDDGSTGTATSYDVRYSTSPITSSNFTSATSVTGEPTPTASGTTQTMTVTGLSAGTTYYFAMKTSDEVLNISAISNVVSRATSAPACEERWGCSAWSTCTNNTQTRTCTDSNNCGTTALRPTLTQSCSATPPGPGPTGCTENWSCSGWGKCTSGKQTQTCTDLNACGTTANKPATSQTCTATSCTANYVCDNWSGCRADNTQTRLCTDKNGCPNNATRIESRTCQDSVADVTPPDTAITTFASPVTSDKVQLSFSGNDNKSLASKLKFEYQLDDQPVTAAVGSSAVLKNLTNGPHTIKVWAIDEANNKDQTPAQVPFSVTIRQYIVTIPKSNGASLVRVFNDQGKLVTQFNPFPAFRRWGGSVAVGDVDNNGTNEIIVAPGRGGKPTVAWYDMKGKKLGSFLAYPDNFIGGVNVAIADLDDDGTNEIITAPASGTGPLVRVFKSNGSMIAEAAAFERTFRGGVSIAAGKLAPNGKAYILAAQASNGNGEIIKLELRDGKLVSAGGGPAITGSTNVGVSLALGRVEGLSTVQILATATQGATGSSMIVLSADLIKQRSFTLADQGFSGGFTLASGDLNNFDNQGEIVAATYSGSRSRITMYSPGPQWDKNGIIKVFYPYGWSRFGVNIAVGHLE